MTTLVVLSVVDIVAAHRGPGGLPVRRRDPAGPDRHQPRGVRGRLSIRSAHAAPIIPGVDHINRTGGVVAGALPLLYDMAEGIVVGVTPQPEQPVERGPAVPASGRRRSRLHDAVGYSPTRVVSSLTRPRQGAAASSDPVLGSRPGGERPGGRRLVLTDPFVLPRPLELLLVAARAVDRAEFLGDLLPVRPKPAGHLVGADVHLPPVARAPIQHGAAGWLNGSRSRDRSSAWPT